MAIQTIDGFEIKAPVNIDNRYGPFSDTTEANTRIESFYRYIGLTVLLTGSGTQIEYWYNPTIADEDLIPKGAALSISGSNGQVVFFSGSTALSGSPNFIFNYTSSTPTFNVSGAISASFGIGSVGFYGTASWALNAQTASFITASNVWGPFGSSSVTSASYALTASFITGAGVFGPFGSNSVLSASYASRGGDVTKIIAGTNITIDPPEGTGSVTINASAAAGSGVAVTATASFTNLSTWNFTHNLQSRYVIIQALDVNHNQIIPENITLVDSSSAVLTFPTLESGYAVASIGGVTSSFSLTSSTVITNFGGKIYDLGNDLVIQPFNNLIISGNMIPGPPYTANTSSYNLGSPTAAWNHLYVANGSVVFITGSNTADLRYTGTHIAATKPFSGSFSGSFNGTASWAQSASQAVSASFAATASYVSSNFQYEIHVSQIDGNDTTGDGSLLKPVATITKALTLLAGSRKTVIVHPGTYLENVTVANTNTTISTSELTGANTLLSGTLTIGTLGSGTRISGLKMSSLVISGTAQAYISNCTVDTQVTKSSSGYVEIINSELQCTLGIQISGAGITIINGNKNENVTVSNASAQVIIKGCNSVVTPSASAGNLAIVDCIVTAVGGNAITITGASTTLTLLNSQVLVQAGDNVAPISVAGIYSIINTIYNKSGSTFTGTSTNSVDYFQYIDADSITTRGLTVTGSMFVSGSTTIIGSSVISGSLNVTGSLRITGSGYINELPILTSANTSSFADGFGWYGAFCSTGSQTNPVGNVSRSMQLDTVEHSNGVSVVGGSRITFAHTGVYNIQFSAQLESTAAGDNTVNIWFKKNGSNVARSNTLINAAKQAGDKVVAAWNYVDTANANDYYEIVWQAADTAMQLLAASASGNIPLTPSVIVTATQVG